MSITFWQFAAAVLVIAGVWMFGVVYRQAKADARARALSGESAADRLRARGETRR